MAILALRTMVTAINGKVVRAVLQHQIGDVETGKIIWEDVRELEVLDDNTIVLSRSDERIRTIEI